MCKNLFQQIDRTKRAYNTENLGYEIIEPCHKVTYPIRSFPKNIQKPNYAFDGQPNKHNNTRLVKSKEEIQKIWTSCRIAKRILMATGERVEVTLLWRDDFLYFNLLNCH